MKTILARTALALGTLLYGGNLLLADGFGFDSLEQRLAGQQSRHAGEARTRPAAYIEDTYSAVEDLPSWNGDSGSRGSYPGGAAYGGYPSNAHCGDACYGAAGYCHGDGYACGHGDWCSDPYCSPYGYPGGGPIDLRHHHAGRRSATMCYGEVHNLLLRPHVSERAVGKLSESYEYSPRFVLGAEAASGLGVRARYWWYHRTTANLDVPFDALRLEFDVIDLEATHRFRTTRSDLVVAGGVRWAKVVAGARDLAFTLPDRLAGTELSGLTVAADARSIVWAHGRFEWATVGGARWSLLGGDWEGQPFQNPFIEPTRDDNVVVKELYGGVECLYRGYRCSMYARLTFEMQNWHSDALAHTSGTDSIGFLGPAIHAGVTF